MVKTLPLAELGTTVRVDIDRIEFRRLSKKVLKSLSENSSGKIIDYKMTDGMGIGFVLELSDGTISWFFDHEIDSPYQLDESDLVNLVSEDSSLDSGFGLAFPILSKTIYQKPKIDIKSLSYFLNPLNFYNWFIYSTKDVF